MKCDKCGTECSDNANFCNNCGRKLKTVCNCWIKKELYNCGADKCPSYKLFKMEKHQRLIDLMASSHPKSITN